MYLQSKRSVASNEWMEFDFEVRPVEAFSIRKVIGASHLSSLLSRLLSTTNRHFYLEAEANIFLFLKGFLCENNALTYFHLMGWGLLSR